MTGADSNQTALTTLTAGAVAGTVTAISATISGLPGAVTSTANVNYAGGPYTYTFVVMP